MLLDIFNIAHFIQTFLSIHYTNKNTGALKFVNDIPLNTNLYYATALETVVERIGLLSF